MIVLLAIRRHLVRYFDNVMMMEPGLAPRLCAQVSQYSIHFHSLDYIVFTVAVVCQDIPDPDNGNILFMDDNVSPFVNGTRAVYICDTGYRLEGESDTRVCDGENWSGAAPVCTRRCNPTGKPLNYMLLMLKKLCLRHGRLKFICTMWIIDMAFPLMHACLH